MELQRTVHDSATEQACTMKKMTCKSPSNLRFYDSQNNKIVTSWIPLRKGRKCMAHREALAQAAQVVWESGIALRVGILWDVTVTGGLPLMSEVELGGLKDLSGKVNKVLMSARVLFHIPGKNDVSPPMPTKRKRENESKSKHIVLEA